MAFLFQVAWRNLWRQGRRSLITASAMAIGVALCMFMTAFADGMYVKMFDVLVSQKLGHAQVHHPDYPRTKILHDTIPDGDALLAEIDALPETEAATARLFSYGLLASSETSTGGQLLGVQAEREQKVRDIDSDIVEGSFDISEGRAVVGKGLAKTLEIGVGDELIVIVQAADGSMGNELYEVSGVFSTGAAALDRAGAFVSLEALQQVAALPDAIHEILVLTQDPEGSEALANAIKGLPDADDVLVRPWFEADPTTYDMMQLQDAGMFMMLFFVFALASFGVLNTMLMAVFERTRELGVLRAIGLGRGQLMALVILESCFLGLLAITFGGVLGGLLDWWAVTQGVPMGAGVEQMDGFEYQGVSFGSRIYGVVRPEGVVITLSMVFIVCVLASLWPAWRAAHLRPVEAMREV